MFRTYNPVIDAQRMGYTVKYSGTGKNGDRTILEKDGEEFYLIVTHDMSSYICYIDSKPKDHEPANRRP